MEERLFHFTNLAKRIDMDQFVSYDTSTRSHPISGNFAYPFTEKTIRFIMEHLTLSIKFTAKPENATSFKEILHELFRTISSEPNFINATIHEGLGKPEEFLVYETWNDNIENFLRVQMKKHYAVAFEQKLADMDIKREPYAYTPFAHFGTHLIEEATGAEVR